MARRFNLEARYRCYGITPELAAKAYTLQSGCCAICGFPEKENKRKLDMDHDHTSGKFRGFLCSHCNNVLGMARDNAEILKQAYLYLKRGGIKWAV